MPLAEQALVVEAQLAAYIAQRQEVPFEAAQGAALEQALEAAALAEVEAAHVLALAAFVGAAVSSVS